MDKADLNRKEFENECDALSLRAADWIVNQLAGCRDATGGRIQLELEIYHWLIDHAIFEESKA